MPSEKRARQRVAREQKMVAIQRAKKRRKMAWRTLIGVVVVAIIVAIVYALSSSSGKPSASKGGSTTTSTKTGKGTTTSSTPSSTSTTIASVPTAPDQTGGTLTAWKCPATNGSSPHILHFPDTQPPMCIDPSKAYTVTLTTNEGDITIALDTSKTPETANNFVVLSLYHYYDGTSIDRIDPSIDIEQTGSPSTQTIEDPGPGYTIKDEGSGYKYSAGDVVMARGSAANSGAAQYFFVYGSKASELDSQGTYVTFGHVTGDSLAVLKKIAALYEPCPASDTACLGGFAKTVVLISKVTVTES